MQMNYDALHMSVEIITGLVTAAIAGLSLKIRLSQSEQQLKSERQAGEIKAELIARDEKTARALEVHQAEDRGQFTEIHRSLDRIEKNQRNMTREQQDT